VSAVTNAERTAVCIYCLRTADRVEFDREHIIPQAVGGNLYLDGLVCKDCNSKLGREVDCEILKVPDVLRAMDELEIPYDRAGVLRSYFETHLDSERGLLGAQPKADELVLHIQDLEDGSRIFPGYSGFEAELKKQLLRDGTLERSGIDITEIDRLLADLSSRLRDASVDEPVECPELGIVAIKRSEAMTGKVIPKSEARMDRLIGKIALEWFFFCLGKRFVEFASWAEDLRNLAWQGRKARSIHVFRSLPEDSSFRRSHELYFVVVPRFTRLVVSFFGGIEYTLVAPDMDDRVFDYLEEHGSTGAVGIAFRQDLSRSAKLFFTLMADGSSELLENLGN